MTIAYLITPFITWFVTGILKFIINCIAHKRIATDLIGYGGMPSNHSAIVSSITFLIAFKEGIENPAFGVAVALSFIVMLDANSLRNQIGKQAKIINNFASTQLRERVGHTKPQILIGCFVGCAVAFFINYLGV